MEYFSCCFFMCFSFFLISLSLSLSLSLCRYSLFSAVSTVSPDCLVPHLTAISTVMLLSLKSTEGVTVSANVEDFAPPVITVAA